MGILVRVADKIVFAALFLTAMQVPILADHYRQYLSGFYDATADQVARYQSLADEFGYASVDELIDRLSANRDPVVSKDAQNKRDTVAMLGELESGISTLRQGHYYEQAFYMFTPAHHETLQRVIRNFSPSIPLAPEAVLFSLITAIVLNMFLWTPHWCYCRVRNWRHRHSHTAKV